MSADRSGKQRQVRRSRPAVDDPIRDLDQPSRADPARDRLAAGLARAEPGQEAREVHDAGAVVGDDHRARPDVGAGRAQRLEVIRRVERVRRQQATGRTADEERLDRSTARQRAAEPDDLAAAACRAGPRRSRRRPASGAGRGSCRGHDPRTGRRERLGAVAEDPRDRGEGLDVVDHGRHVVEAALGGMRRALLGLAALALERLEQDGLLAEHVRALDRPDGHRQVVARSEDVEPEEAGFLGGRDRRLEPADRLGRLGPDRDDRLAWRRSRTRRWPRPRRPRTGRAPSGTDPCPPPGPRRTRWPRRSGAALRSSAAVRHLSAVG